MPDNIGAVALSEAQIRIGKAIREAIENASATDALYGMAAALDQYRADYILDPTSSIRTHRAIVSLMGAAIA